MKNVLVTGATSGIGLTIANKLHQSGVNVFGTSRFPEKYQHQFAFELLELDITSQESIQHCVATLSAKSVVLDALINNAGITINGSAEETSSALAYKQMDTNFWGAVNMTKAILPLMRAQQKGHIITIGSLAGLIGTPFQSYYSASKHALEGFFKSLRLEVKPFNIQVSVIEPGFFKTNLNQSFEYAQPTIAAYDKARTSAVSAFSSSIEKASSPDPVAEVAVRILGTPHPRFSYRVGLDAKMLPILQFFSYRFFEWGAAKTFGL
ncbi:SDR family oxidoreductase [Spirosoma flavum]|uniref:SDR family oxidoreductase n=1 Tax=Spirosoma flavum TaxID=2048557 RepID=A0ABW6AI37_9BACT